MPTLTDIATLKKALKTVPGFPKKGSFTKGVAPPRGFDALGENESFFF